MILSYSPVRLLLLFLLSICITNGDTLRGIVIRVVDGDTITVLEKTPEGKRTYQIRLEGIDSPERGQDGYEGAKDCLEKLIWGETVTVQYTEKDQYGRILGLILYGELRVNDEMVKEGWAWRYKHSTSRKLASYESEARAAKKGFWAQPNPVPPWEWKARRKMEVKTHGEDKKSFY